jgi:hypothetical protein
VWAEGREGFEQQAVMTVYAPSEGRVMTPIKELCYCDADWLMHNIPVRHPLNDHHGSPYLAEFTDVPWALTQLALGCDSHHPLDTLRAWGGGLQDRTRQTLKFICKAVKPKIARALGAKSLREALLANHCSMQAIACPAAEKVNTRDALLPRLGGRKGPDDDPLE